MMMQAAGPSSQGLDEKGALKPSDQDPCLAMDDLAYDPDPGRPPRGSRVEMENLDVHPGSCEKRSCGWPDPYSLTALAQLSGYSHVTAGGILQETKAETSRPRGPIITLTSPQIYRRQNDCSNISICLQ